MVAFSVRICAFHLATLTLGHLMVLRSSVSLGLVKQDKQVKGGFPCWHSQVEKTILSVSKAALPWPRPLLLVSICLQYSNMAGGRVAMICVFPLSTGRAGKNRPERWGAC